MSTATPVAVPAENTEPRTKSLGWVLAVCCVAQFMVILDLSIVNVALPSIQSALGFSSADLQWVVDAYAITFAGFLMLGGRSADRLGQRNVFVTALVLFALTSLVDGLSQTSAMLVIARAVQGTSCAFMAASSLAIITASFAPGPQLNRAIGLWAAMNGAGGAAGVLFGGIITQEFSWRWVLLINPPIGIAAALVAFAVVRNRRREADLTSFDIPGALSLTIGQIVLVYGIVEGGLRGWGTAIAVVPMVLGVLILIAFGLIESRFAKNPLVPFAQLSKPLRDANTIVLLFSAALFPLWYLSSLYLQQVLGLSPLDTGLIFLPMTLVIMFTAQRAGPLVSRFGVRTTLIGGLLMLGTGLALMTRIGPSGSPIVFIMIPGLITCAGIALSIVPSTIAATQAAGPGQAGLASGMINTSRQVGGGLGLAVLATLATSRTSHLIGSGHPVPQALTSGFRLGFVIAAGVVAAALVMTLLVIPRAPGRSGRPVLAVAALAVVLFLGAEVAIGGSRGAPIGAYILRGTVHFRSRPGLHPPQIRADVPIQSGSLAPGYILLSNFYNVSYPPMVGQSGPMILDNKLHLVWFHPVPTNVVAANLNLQTYRGQPVLAWWQGDVTNTGQTLSGKWVIVNRHYQTIGTLHGAQGWVLTLHDLEIAGDHAWVTANRNVPMNLGRFGGAYNGALIDSAVQEYDLRTGRLMYSWDALKHIPLGDSQATIPTNGYPWDAYHVNSFQLVGDGTFVVSMRNTWAAYRVKIADQRIEWTLGGPSSSFSLGPGAHFQWQHDVRVYPDGLVTMFDDHCCQLTGGGTYVAPSGPSRGLVLKLDRQAHRATRVTQYLRTAKLDADYMGSVQPLPGGNEFVGWGSQPFFSEFSSSGRLLLDATMPDPDLSYRAMLEPWTGEPLSSPAVAVDRRQGRTLLSVSWNGSTLVRRWRVQARRAGGRWQTVAIEPKNGFETTFAVPASASRYAVQALGAGGQVLGRSAPTSVATKRRS